MQLYNNNLNLTLTWTLFKRIVRAVWAEVSMETAIKKFQGWPNFNLKLPLENRAKRKK